MGLRNPSSIIGISCNDLDLGIFDGAEIRPYVQTCMLLYVLFSNQKSELR